MCDTQHISRVNRTELFICIFAEFNCLCTFEQQLRRPFAVPQDSKTFFLNIHLATTIGKKHQNHLHQCFQQNRRF